MELGYVPWTEDSALPSDDLILKGEKAPDTLEASHWVGEFVLRIGEAEAVGTANLGVYVLHPIRRHGR